MVRSAALRCAVVLFLLLTACNRHGQEGAKPEANSPAPAAATAESAAPAAGAAPVVPAGVIKKGKVAETLEGGGYTYFLADDGKDKTWVAVLKSEVAVGQDISYYDGMVMQNFTSKSLNRTFDRIIFSSGIVDPNKPAGPPTGQTAPAAGTGNPAAADPFAEALKNEGQSGAAQPAAMAPPGSKKAVVPFAEIHVDKAKGEDAYTVGEIFAKAATLTGKTVQVRGKVMKVSANIMGRNWIHLQDGTGNPKENSHDLVVTSSMVPKEGSDVITAKGVLAANKDFGAGYVYAVILEQAELSQ